MGFQNMSDIIEAYLKKALRDQEQVEIRRSEIANRFDCVPSQINYVIKTRFTVQQGYIVESKRGGGGFIRISKVKLLDDADMISEMIKIIGETINENNAVAIVKKLYGEEVVSRREAKLMLVAMENTLYTGEKPVDELLRANILKSMLKTLQYEKTNH